MDFNRVCRYVASVVVVAASHFVAAHAETVNCVTIANLPFVITAQGVYCLTGDLVTGMSTGNAIEIQTNNVTIDLNGHKLGGQAAGPGTQTNGIYALDHSNITVKNGTIRGFRLGVFLKDDTPGYAGTGGHVLENLRADGNTVGGLYVQGRGNIIRSNQVVSSGNTAPTSWPQTYGIQAVGPSARVLNNDVNGTTAGDGATASGIYLDSASNSFLENNRISDTTGKMIVYGIFILNSQNVAVRENTVNNALRGIFFSSSSGFYMGNIVMGVTFEAYSGGTAVGFNAQ
jgi:parallel beta-helix repeat protein